MSFWQFLVGFWHFLQQNWLELFTLIRDHLALVFLSTLIALVIGIPTGILLTRKKNLRGPILGVEPNVREAAVAMGMTDRQILLQVELPLAMTVILTGVRVATVIAVGVTTIAAAVGAGGLGVYIFRGLRQYDNNLLLAGAVAAALIALGLDYSLGVVEQSFSVTARRRPRVSFVQKLSVTVIAILLLGVVSLSWRGPSSTRASTTSQKVVVGSKDFTEWILLSEIVAQM